MGVISSRIRRHRRTRLAAEMACTWTPRRLFPLGTEQGGVYYPDDPNALLRRRNRATNTGFTLGTTGATPTDWIERGLITGRKTVDATTSSGFCMRVTGGGGSVGGSDDARLTTVTGLTVGDTYTVRFKAKNAGGTQSPRIAMASTSADISITSSWATYTFNSVATSATNGVFFGAAVAGAIYDVTDIEVLSQANLAFSYQLVTDWNTEYMAAVGHLVTQFTDSTGTTPVTKVTDPVGLTLDRRFGLYRGPQLFTSGAIGLTGSATAATYSTTTGAGTVTRVDASNQSWVQFSGLTAGRSYQITVSGVSGGTLQVRDGSVTGTVIASTTSATPCLVTATGTTITLTASAAATVAFTVTQIQWLPGNHRIQATSGSRKTLSARVNLLLATATMSTQNVTTVATSHKLSFTGTGTVTLTGTSTAGPLVGTGANDRVSLTFTPTAGTLTLTVSGSVTLADLRTADDAAKAIPPYQGVRTASDHDTDGFPHFWLYDGTDDSDATASTVDGSASDKAVLIAGATKNSDAATAVLVEHGIPSSADSMLMAPRTAAQPGFGADLRNGGLISTVPVASGFPAPVTAVFCVSMDKSAATIAGQAIMRANGITRAPSPSGSGPVTGNFGDRTLYIGNRGGGGLPFNGREYATILRFGPMSDGERNQAERWVAQRMGVTI